MKPEEIGTKLAERFQEGLEPLEARKDGILQFRVEPRALLDVTAFLKEKGFKLLIDVGGVDYLPRSPRFEVVYNLLNLDTLARVILRCSPPDEDPRVPSVSGLWPSALPAEREVYDLFGIVFEGHPQLTRILMPDDWEGHPLRKDYPLRGKREYDVKHAADRNRYHAPKLSGER